MRILKKEVKYNQCVELLNIHIVLEGGLQIIARNWITKLGILFSETEFHALTQHSIVQNDASVFSHILRCFKFKSFKLYVKESVSNWYFVNRGFWPLTSMLYGIFVGLFI